MTSPLIGYFSVFMIVLGVSVAIYLALTDVQRTVLFKIWAKYLRFLSNELRFLFAKQKPTDVMRMQFLGVVISLVMGYLLDNLLIGVILAAATIFVPILMFRKKREERVQRIEDQLESWLMMLSNALRATPALGDALESTVGLVQPPISQEIDLLVKSYKLGTPLDKAIHASSERIASPVVTSALSTLIIARQTGGDLPTILERASASLREMARLEGVVRTKTAEGKGQLMVLAMMPIIMTLLINLVEPGWMDPLGEAFAGTVIIVVASLCWVAGVIWARIILDVDI